MTRKDRKVEGFVEIDFSCQEKEVLDPLSNYSLGSIAGTEYLSLSLIHI